MRILLVEDEPWCAKGTSRLLRAQGHHVVIAETLAAGAAALREAGAFQGVLLDLGLPDGNGEDLLELVGLLRSPPPVLVISGTADGDRRMKLGPVPFIPKPIGPEGLRTAIELWFDDPVSRFARRRRLPPRVVHVLRLSRAGLPTREIAARLRVTSNTVKSYWKRLRRACGAESNADVLEALRREEQGG